MSYINLNRPLTRWEQIKRRLYTGRKYGQSKSVHIDNHVQQHKAVMLCGFCQPTFPWKQLNYYSVNRYEGRRPSGQCSACHAFIEQGHGYYFIHEEHLKQVWQRPDERRARREQQLSRSFLKG